MYDSVSHPVLIIIIIHTITFIVLFTTQVQVTRGYQLSQTVQGAIKCTPSPLQQTVLYSTSGELKIESYRGWYHFFQAVCMGWKKCTPPPPPSNKETTHVLYFILWVFQIMSNITSDYLLGYQSFKTAFVVCKDIFTIYFQLCTGKIKNCLVRQWALDTWWNHHKQMSHWICKTKKLGWK